MTLGMYKIRWIVRSSSEYYNGLLWSIFKIILQTSLNIFLSHFKDNLSLGHCCGLFFVIVETSWYIAIAGKSGIPLKLKELSSFEEIFGGSAHTKDRFVFNWRKRRVTPA